MENHGQVHTSFPAKLAYSWESDTTNIEFDFVKFIKLTISQKFLAWGRIKFIAALIFIALRPVKNTVLERNNQ